MTADTIDRSTRAAGHLRGEEHPGAVYSQTQVAAVKRMLADAPRVTRLAPGELRRISASTGIPRGALLHIRNGKTWVHVEPAPAAEGDNR